MYPRPDRYLHRVTWQAPVLYPLVPGLVLSHLTTEPPYPEPWRDIP